MRSPIARAAAIGLLIASSLVFAACRRGDSATPTAGAGTPEAGTALPVVPTVPILTALPTFAPLPTVTGPALIPTVTPLVPSPIPTTNQSGGGSAPTPNPLAQARGTVFITRLRLAPEVPHNKEDVTFFAVFDNTGKSEQTPWCVEVFRPGERKSFGITRCNVKPIPNAVSEQATSGWQIAGIRECVPLLARAVIRDEEDNRTPFHQPNGQDLWLNFTACP
jgi:hypothetical protein